MLKHTQKSSIFNVAKTALHCVSEPAITEVQIHQQWKKLHFPVDFLTVDGTPIMVIDGGIHNLNAGPDFKNATVLVNGKIERGDVEIHQNERGWSDHGHHNDARYKNVILHVVTHLSKSRSLNSFQFSPNYTVVLAESSDPKTGQENGSDFWCKTEPMPSHGGKLLESLGWRRIHQKARMLSQQLQKKSTEDVWYRTLLRVLGYSQNTVQMEQVATHVPFRVASEISLHGSPENVAAFVLGLTGLAEHFNIAVPYWEAAVSQYQIQSFSYYHWRPLRSHPQNHPVIRLYHLFRILPKLDKVSRRSPRKITAQKLLKQLRTSITIPEKYQKYFPAKTASLGKSRALEIVVNLWMPFYLARSHHEADHILREWSSDLPPLPVYAHLQRFIEETTWEKVLQGRQLHPLTIQGLLWLRHHYCSEKLCELCPALQETGW